MANPYNATKEERKRFDDIVSIICTWDVLKETKKVFSKEK